MKTKVFKNQKQLKKLVSALREAKFERFSVCQYSEIWKNQVTGEEVLLLRR